MERLELTPSQALNLHKTMWKEMQEELGDCPSPKERMDFKLDWCKKHFPNKRVHSHCFLCEYITQRELECKNCLVEWNRLVEWNPSQKIFSCLGEISCNSSPISTILALPVRKEELLNG